MALLEETIQQLGRPAILLGNGINNLENSFLDWKSLLHKLGGENLNFEGLTYNEMYDFIEIHSANAKELKLKVCEYLQSPQKENLHPHLQFLNLAQTNNCPVLTTNFDLALESAKDLEFFKTKNKGFTRFYPWDRYYGQEELSMPTEGFGVWHIHGLTRYHDSIRLGLTDYMGSVEKARNWIHKGESRLFNGKNQSYWRGKDTWLHIWFNMPLIIVGLKLESQEVFIRWLLIERERYFKQFPERRKETVFMSTGSDLKINNFLENLNIIHRTAHNYRDLYN
ncbi:SIR2 family protein [Polaribacter sp. Z014]|uniref:SIR2 family protein n=1 Tax=Polaribacter sp. Z014 TaxID=2927126 RepID=UPI002020CB10|nr:SIR2 family protein [Polaribacter sp. Z014]MCL7765060.1 SIR2 family protein [Polaribacter sp. Z014]